jgi:hypothetical protein
MMNTWTRAAALVTLFTIICSCTSISANEPVALFDGKSLDNWTVITCEAVVEDGTILLKSGNGLVQTKKQYADYVFEFEWKALKPDNWDSGIYFRYDTIPQGRPWPKQYQVNLRKGMEGDLGGFREAVNSVSVKPHEWNRFELTVKGSTAALRVNGQSAWKVDGLENPSGYIALQSEVPGGGQFLFRKIRITELTE